MTYILHTVLGGNLRLLESEREGLTIAFGGHEGLRTPERQAEALRTFGLSPLAWRLGEEYAVDTSSNRYEVRPIEAGQLWLVEDGHAALLAERGERLASLAQAGTLGSYLGQDGLVTPARTAADALAIAAQWDAWAERAPQGEHQRRQRLLLSVLFETMPWYDYVYDLVRLLEKAA